MRLITFLFSVLTIGSIANPFTVFTSRSGLINTHVNCIEKGANFIWVGTNSGINRIVFEGTKPVKFSPRGTSVAVTALEDDGKVVWVGLKGKGVYQMPKENYKFIGFRKDILGDKEIVKIERTTKGLKVFTPDHSYTFDFSTKEFKTAAIDIKKYVPNINVGGKQLLNNEGVLARYNEATKSFRPFAQQYVAKADVGFQGGRLIASPSGLLFYNPAKDTILFGEPAFKLASFQLNGEDTVALGLDLNWDEHLFKYQFNFIELGNPDQITLSYKVTGGEHVIENSVSANEGIEIKGLAHGTYQVEVSAKNAKGIVAKNVLKYKFSIANPLQDSIWLYMIVGFITGVWTVVIMAMTRAKFKKDIRVLEDALLEKTNKLNQIEKGKYGLVDEDKVDI